jgi:hypothetical protein
LTGAEMLGVGGLVVFVAGYVWLGLHLFRRKRK